MFRPSLEWSCALVLCVLLLPQNAEKKAGAPPGRVHVKITEIPARPADIATLDGIMKAYYEVVSGPSGEPRQWDRDHTLYIPEIRFVVINEDANGKIASRSLSHQQFADETTAALGNNAFYEHEVHTASRTASATSRTY